MKIMAWILAIAGVMLLLILRENKRLVVSSYDITSDKLPEVWNGSKIVVLSDLHNNQFGKDNEKLLEKIQNESPDLIIVAGDMPVARARADNSTAVDFLRQLSLKYKIIYGNGNHEQKMPANKVYAKEIRSFGITLLVNEKETNHHVDIYGLEIGEAYYNKFHRPCFSKEYLDKLLGTPDKSKFNILIAHNPMYFKEYAEWGADLVLSGHVHGGIVSLPKLGGVISPQYVFFPEYDAGKFEEGNSTLILSRGLGTHTIKMRLFNPAEVVSICLTNRLDKIPRY